MRSPPWQKFPALTGSRAIAAYLVFVSHIVRPGLETGPLTDAVLNQTRLSLNVFFVLGGFFIAQKYYETASLQPGWLLRYARNRLARLYPMYFLVTVVALVVAGRTDPRSWWIHLTYGVGFARPEHIQLFHAWSMSVTESFQLFAPLTFVWARRLGFLRGLLATVLLGASLSVLLWRNPLLASTYLLETPWNVLLRAHWGRLVEFGVGAYLGSLMARKVPLRLPDRLKRLGWTGSGLLAVLVPVLCCVALEAALVDKALALRLVLALDLGIVPVGLGLLFWGLATEDTLLCRVLAHPVTVLLGQGSYLFYLLHLGPLRDLLMLRLGWSPLAFFIALNLLCVIAYRWLEEPLHQRLRSPVRRDSRPAEAVPAVIRSVAP